MVSQRFTKSSSTPLGSLWTLIYFLDSHGAFTTYIHAAQYGHHCIVRTVDTDVVVLAVMVVETQPVKFEVWLAFVLGRISDTLSIGSTQNSSSSRTKEITRTLRILYVLCINWLSLFVGRGKKTAWAVWNSFPDLTRALLKLAHAPKKIEEHCLHVIMKLVILFL